MHGTFVRLEGIDGDRIEINTALVGAIHNWIRADGKPAPGRCVVNVLGVEYKVRGDIQKVAKALGWATAEEGQGQRKEKDPEPKL